MKNRQNELTVIQYGHLRTLTNRDVKMAKFRTALATLVIIFGLVSNIYGQDKIYPVSLNSPQKIEQWLEKMEPHNKDQSYIKLHFLIPIQKINNELKNYQFKSDMDISWRSYHDFLVVKLLKLATEGYEAYPHNKELRLLFMELQNLALDVSLEANSVFQNNYQKCKGRSTNNGLDCNTPFDRAKFWTLGIGLNKINVPFRFPILFMLARNNYEIEGWELEFREDDKFDSPGYFKTYSLEFLEISDKNVCAPEIVGCSSIEGLSRQVVNNWITSGKIVNFKALFSGNYRHDKWLRPYLSFGPGIFFMHEARRYGTVEERDKYRFGLSMISGGGINLFIVDRFLVSTGGELQWNFFAAGQVRYKLGASYIF